MSKKVLLLACAFLLAINAQAVIRYVKPNGTALAENAANANSWLTACADLQAVINASDYNGDTIFVAAGTYKPIRQATVYQSNTITLNDRENSFVIRKSIYIFGNFAGTENSLEERQLPASGDYTSILSGDFNDDDGASFSGTTENAYHILLILDRNMATNVRIDGFTIRGGNANGGNTTGDVTTVAGFQFEKNRGGGIFCTYSVAPVLTNLKITGNTATLYGGGIYNTSSNPVLNNVIISENRTTGIPKGNSGGGGGIDNVFSNPVLTDVVISGNMSDYGGGMGNGYGTPVINNVRIIGNTATIDGGGIYNGFSNPVLTNVIISGNTSNRLGGGIYIGGNNTTLGTGYISNTIMTNAVISGNTASDKGGGMYISSCAPILTNITVSQNTANSGSGIYNYSYSETTFSTPQIRNSIIWANTSDNVFNTDYSTPVYSYSLVEGETVTAGIILNSDPLFDDDFHLQKGSPCINAGNNLFLEAEQTPDLSAITKDLDGKLRIIKTIDLGAYEYQFHTVTFAGDEIDIDPQTIEHRNHAAAPNTPERAGCDFSGWFTDNGTFANAWDFEIDLVTQDTTLWAKWSKLTTGITEMKSVSVKIYPNPVTDEMRIESSDLKINQVEISDLSGRIIYMFANPINQINVSALPQGIYFVRMETNKGIVTEKFVKK
jgi:uncharacterized repeat protein (TIGR02543 family)